MVDRNAKLPDAAISTQRGFWGKAWLIVKTIQARLRFVVLLVAIGGLIAYWDTLNAYYEKWTRPLDGADLASGDVEFFCPMHPYIVRDTPKEKCPICHMDLAKRKKGTGTSEALPPGTVSRVQLTPYRVVLAGVQTSEVGFHPLSKEITTFGSVEFNETTEAHIATRQKGRIIKMHVNFTGQVVQQGEELATLDVRYSPELTVTVEDLLKAHRNGDQALEGMARKRLHLWDVSDRQIENFLGTGKANTLLTIYSPIKGHVIKKYQKEGNFVDEGTPLYDVANLESVWIQAQVYEADQALLREGLKVQATTLAFPSQVFEGTLDFIYPHLDESSRTLTVRFRMPNPEHKLRPGDYATVTIRVPPSDLDPIYNGLADRWRNQTFIDQLAGTLANATGLTRAGLEPLLDAAGRYAALERGLALAVPESAVIDTGSMKIVYREAEKNVYEGVLVELGPRMTAGGNSIAFYPILRGLDVGDRVVTHGSFLIDAETRLNPAVGSVYFGGGGSKVSQSGAPVRPSTPVEFNEEDNRLIDAQKLCPITNKPLGVMGPPLKIMIQNRPVFLCCDGCKEQAVDNSLRTLAAVDQLKRKGAPLARP